MWSARLSIAVVVAWNLQCALVYFITPQVFAPGFELAGVPGEAAVRGMAVLFLMWNIPHLVALWHPLRQRTSLWEALAMQTLGLLGETTILLLLPAGHARLQAALLRFILFDAAGLLLLVSALLLLRKQTPSPARA